MKPLIPYVGTNDYVKESFGFIGAKTNKPNKLKALFAEASSVQKCNILNAIYENYEAHNLSENQSLHLISLVERADDLCDIAIEYIESIDDKIEIIRKSMRSLLFGDPEKIS